MDSRDTYRFWFLTAAVALLGALGVALRYDGDKESAMTYDYLARTARWDQIIDRATASNPDDELSIAYLNLALAKTGQLGDRMFEFRQIGTDGLLPPQRFDFTSQLPAAETYYHLGMLSTAERYAYEIQEAIPDHQKSRRMRQRLLDIYRQRGDSLLARKLSRTLGDDGLAAPVILDNAGLSQSEMLTQDSGCPQPDRQGPAIASAAYPDRFFQTEAPQNMLGLHFTDNPANRMAYEYLLAWALLDRDLQGFLQYFSLSRDFDYPSLPRSYQEALMIIWSSQTNTVANMPWAIDPEIAAQTREFLTDMSGHDIDYMRKKHDDTYFLYFIDHQ